MAKPAVAKYVRKLCKFFSYFYPEKIIKIIKEIYKYIYSEKIARKFAEITEEFTVSPPSYLRGTQYMHLGKGFTSGKGLILECWDGYGCQKYSPKLVIGENAHLGRNNHIGCINQITIGDNLLTGRNVYITDHYHGKIDTNELETIPIKRNLYSKGSIKIGDNVWLGDNVAIMPNVRIGNNVIVGANAVVTKDIDNGKVVAGVPAKVIKNLL